MNRRTIATACALCAAIGMAGFANSPLGNGVLTAAMANSKLPSGPFARQF